MSVVTGNPPNGVRFVSKVLYNTTRLACIATSIVVVTSLDGARASSSSIPVRDGDWSWNDGRIDSEVATLLGAASTPSEDRSTPEVGAFVRSTGATSIESDRFGTGGVDLRWKGGELLDVGIVFGAAMEVDPYRSGDAIRQGVGTRATAFDGFDFGGRSARDVNPFHFDTALRRQAGRDDLDSTFLAAQVSLRPTAETRIGFVATASGENEGVGLVGVDVAQKVAEHEVRGWLQQRTGVVEAESEQDRAAMGLSLGGRVGEVEYEVDWRRIGDGFDTDVGTVRSIGSHAIGGRFGWGLDLDDGIVRRIDVGVTGRIVSDLDLVQRHVDLSWNALTLTTMAGDRISIGFDQTERQDEDREAVAESRLVVRWASSDRLPIQLRQEVVMGDRDGVAETIWRTTSLWRPTDGLEISGNVDWARYEREQGDEAHMRTGMQAGLGLGSDAVVRSAVALDTWDATCSLRHALGWRIDSRSEIDLSLEQRLPIGPTDRPAEIRARIGGRFSF